MIIIIRQPQYAQSICAYTRDGVMTSSNEKNWKIYVPFGKAREHSEWCEVGQSASEFIRT